MTQEEKLEEAKRLYETANADQRYVLESLFPELKESEDEGICRKLIAFLKQCKGVYGDSFKQFDLNIDDAIAWLEKRAEQKHQYNSRPKYIGEEELLGEQKPADKVETKFHEGDWVILTAGELSTTLQIVKVDTNKKLYWFNDSSYLPIVDEECLHFWSIQDAKDGDVLVSESNCGLGTWYCIFKSLDNDESMTVYCYLARDGRFETKKELCFDKDPFNTNPASKEQRDALMKAMADAGYTFDFESKELRKIEQYTLIPSEDDIHKWGDNILNHARKVLEQNTAEWSEEDEEIHRKCICAMRASACGFPEEEKFVEQVDNWLKSLKERYTWRPSDEQMDALHYVTNFDYGGHKATLVSLYNDLKRLLKI